jgi:hypothetical protein
VEVGEVFALFDGFYFGGLSVTRAVPCIIC